MHLLLHKQRLTKKQIEKLEASHVVAIQTEHLEDFKFLDCEVSKIEIDEMVWAALDACQADDGMYRPVATRLLKNLVKLANEKVQKPAEQVKPRTTSEVA